MPSPESAQIRAGFVANQEAPETPLAIMRQEWEAGASQVVLPPGITVSPVDAGGVHAEWISNPTAALQHVLLFLHGGGYNAGSCITHRELAARLSLAANIRVLLLDYSLAPENPFPAAIEDVAAGYRWLLEGGIVPEQVVIGGDSAGGGLALATLVWLRDHGVPLPAAGVLLSPWLDLTLTGPSFQTRAAVDPLGSYKGFQRAVGYYLGTSDPTHPLASPLFADLRDLPPLLVQVGEHELLLSDSTRLAERAREAGVEVKLEVWEAMWHVWHAWAGTLPEGQQAIERIGAFIREQLGIS